MDTVMNTPQPRVEQLSVSDPDVITLVWAHQVNGETFLNHLGMVARDIWLRDGIPSWLNVFRSDNDWARWENSLFHGEVFGLEIA